MVISEKTVLKRLVELIQCYDPECKIPRKIARLTLSTIVSEIENSKCPTCEEESDEEEERKVVKKYSYPAKIWNCEVCTLVMSTKNRLNHKRSIKHIKNAAALVREEIVDEKN